MFTRQQTMNNYGLPLTYQARMQPDYFADVLPDSELWQADVYRLAAWLAAQSDIRWLIDLGCGHGQKLSRYTPHFDVTGYDYGDNIIFCQRNYKYGEWSEIDLSHEIITEEKFIYPAWRTVDIENGTNKLTYDSRHVNKSVVICADVIEHIPDLTALVETLRNASETAAYVLISTPDRDRLNQGTPNGMPANPAHVREWTRQEFTDWLKSEGLPVIWSGWTVSFDKQRDKRNTILVVLSNSETIDDMPTAFEEAK